MRTSKLLLQAIREGSRNTRLVRIELGHNSAQTEDSCDEASDLEQTLARGDVSVFLRTEDTKDFVLLMNGFAKVPTFLLLPPAAIGISELTLHTGRILVVAILGGWKHRSRQLT